MRGWGIARRRSSARLPRVGCRLSMSAVADITLEEILPRLREAAPALMAEGVTKLAVFRSRARGDARPGKEISGKPRAHHAARSRNCVSFVIARSTCDEAIHSFLLCGSMDCFASSGAHSRDPMARNDGVSCLKFESEAHPQLSSPDLIGRSSIPEAFVMESKGRGVLDTPLSSGSPKARPAGGV
jgi:hypothetical protein